MAMKDFFNPKGVFTTRNLALMALMVAASTVLGMLETFVDPSQKLYSFAYLPRAMAALSFGPYAAVAVAFVSDFTGFLTNPSYGYFFGYAVSAMVTDFICAAFLYKRKITFLRAAAARALVVVLVVFGLNGIWQVFYYGAEAAKYFSLFRLLRNLIQFPLDVYLMVMMGGHVRKFLSGEWK
ncbi:MAG: folate family ECF transporter S component [Clostridiales bacterium]|jgi:ECF transporter S component (folate family)|nr:folate family ECF transporter S component [Clostridiales bacterium]